MMKRGSARFLAILVFAALLLLPAVASFAAGGAEKGDVYTIKFLKGAGGDFQGVITTSDETPIGKILKDKFNIVIEIEPFAGDYKEKTNLMLATGDYPEMVQLVNNDDVVKWIDAGAIIALDDLVAKYGITSPRCTRTRSPSGAPWPRTASSTSTRCRFRTSRATRTCTSTCR